MTANCTASLALVLALGSLAWAQVEQAADDDEFADQVHLRAQEIKPPPENRKWEQIPWLTDLTEGVRVARQESRPILLWGSDDPPLLRC